VSEPLHSARLRVRYAETDQMGVVYYANYLVWFEVARSNWLREAGWSYREMEADGYLLPVLEAHCAYKQSARYDDELDIRAAGVKLSPVRVRFNYQVVRAADGVLLAEGYTVHATLDQQGKPCRLPTRVLGMFDTGA
jgi:acyl-CoA thioester hydrolase